jgi:predicted esterase
LATVFHDTPVRAAEPSPQAAETIPVSFQTGNGWWFDGFIEKPDASARNGWAVMLLGGGLGTDIDWTVPGLMTLDGHPTRDARTLSGAMLDAGFTVLRWQAIRRDDPKHAQDPLMMDVAGFENTVEQALMAWKVFRAQAGMPNNRVFLVGHSLGARRAAILLEKNDTFAGLVTLAGASLVKEKYSSIEPLVETAREEFAKADGNGNGRLDRDEFQKLKATSGFRSADIDRDNFVDIHELVVAELNAHADEWRTESSGGKDKYGYSWGVDTVVSRKISMFCVVGELDRRWLLDSYMITSKLGAAGHEDYTWKVHSQIGHNLGAEREEDVSHGEYGVIAHSRVGPIDENVVKQIVDWLKRRAR